LLVAYSYGQKYAARKMFIAVCGLETVTANQTEQIFTYEYEIGSSYDGTTGSSTWLIYSEEFEPFFNSSDPTYCPIYNYEIVIDYKLGNSGTTFSENTLRASELQVVS
jgi:hypothetical protein